MIRKATAEGRGTGDLTTDSRVMQLLATRHSQGVRGLGSVL